MAGPAWAAKWITKPFLLEELRKVQQAGLAKAGSAFLFFEQEEREGSPDKATGNKRKLV